MTTSVPTLSVILLPTTEHAMRRAIAALRRQSLDREWFETIVAGGADCPNVESDDAKPGMRVRVTPPEASPGASANRAIGEATGTIVVLVPDTIELGAGSLAAHARAHGTGERRRLLVERLQPPSETSFFAGFMHAMIEGPPSVLDGMSSIPMRLRWGAPLSMPRDLCLGLGGVHEDPRFTPILLTELEARARQDGIEIDRLEPTGSIDVRHTDVEACCIDAASIGAALPALYERHPSSTTYTDLGTHLITPVPAARLHDRAAELAALERTWRGGDRGRTGADVDLEHLLKTLGEGWLEVITGSLALGVQQARSGLWPQEGDTKREWLRSAGAAASPAGPTAQLGNPRHLHGLRVIAADSVVEPIVAAGRPAERILRGPSGGWHLYVQLDHPPALGRTAVIEVEYLDSERVVWGLEYDSRDMGFVLASERPGAFKPAAPSVTNTDSGHWRTARFTLDDWRFERGCHGADVRIILLDAVDSGLVVQRISVRTDAGEIDGTAAPVLADLTPTAFPVEPAPLATVVIPVHDRVGYTAACLRALAGSARAPFDVVVVDNGSTDGTAEFLRRCDGIVRIDRPRNEGFAVACNAGAAAARGKHVVFLNNDTLPIPGWLDALLAALRNQPSAAIAGAKLLFPTEEARVQHAGMMVEGLQPVHRGMFAPPSHPSVCHSMLVPAVTGASLAIATREFVDAGGFDPGFQNGYEDVDLCLRLLTRNRLTFYCAQSVLFHHGAISAGRFAQEERNRLRFLARWGSALPVLLRSAGLQS